MARSIRASTKGRGRPKTTGAGLQLVVRVHPPLLSALDAFAADARVNVDAPVTRPEAIRRIISDWLEGNGYLPLDEARASISHESRAAGAAYAKAAAGRRIDKEQIGKSQSDKTKVRRKNELTEMPSGMKSKSRSVE